MPTPGLLPLIQAFQRSASRLQLNYLPSPVHSAFENAYMCWLLACTIVGAGVTEFNVEQSVYQTPQKNSHRINLLLLRDLYLFFMLEMASTRIESNKRQVGRDWSREKHLHHILQQELTEKYVMRVIPASINPIHEDKSIAYFADKAKVVRSKITKSGFTVASIDFRSRNIKLFRGFAQTHSAATRSIGELFEPEIVARPLANRWKKSFGVTSIGHTFFCSDTYDYLRLKNPGRLKNLNLKRSSKDVLRDRKTINQKLCLPSSSDLLMYMANNIKYDPFTNVLKPVR